MKLTPEFLYEISSQLLSYNQLCDELGLTEEQRRDPNAGQWIIEEWRNMVQRSHLYYTKAVMKNRTEKVLPPNPLSMRAPVGGMSSQPDTSNETIADNKTEREASGV